MVHGKLKVCEDVICPTQIKFLKFSFIRNKEKLKEDEVENYTCSVQINLLTPFSAGN